LENKDINFDNHLFRCHALGKINGEYKNKFTATDQKNYDDWINRPSNSSTEKGKRTENMERDLALLIAKKNAPKELPDTCTSYLVEVYESYVHKYNRKVKTKEIEKGLRCEQSGLTMLQNTLFHKRTIPIIKNKEERKNSFIVGSCDTYLPKIVPDIKNCWDWFTLENAYLSPLYFTQLMGYGKLWEAETLILFFCLCNMTEDQFLDEEKKLLWKGDEQNPNGFLSSENPDYLKACEKLRDEYNFERFPVWQRFKVFEFKYDHSFVEKLEKRIVECRIWLNDYHQKKLQFYQENKILMGIE